MNKKKLIGIFLVWVCIYLIFFVIWAFNVSGTASSVVIILHLASMVISFYLVFSFMKNIIENNILSSNKKILWIVFVLFLSPISMIIYYFLHGNNFNKLK